MQFHYNISFCKGILYYAVPLSLLALNSFSFFPLTGLLILALVLQKFLQMIFSGYNADKFLFLTTEENITVNDSLSIREHHQIFFFYWYLICPVHNNLFCYLISSILKFKNQICLKIHILNNLTYFWVFHNNIGGSAAELMRVQ